MVAFVYVGLPWLLRGDGLLCWVGISKVNKYENGGGRLQWWEGGESRGSELVIHIIHGLTDKAGEIHSHHHMAVVMRI